MYGFDEGQTGRGEKRKNEDDETESEDEQGQYYFDLESKEKYYSKKFKMTATDHKVRFNNVLADRDLLESVEGTHKIFHHLLEEVTEGMNPKDQVRFILRSEQLDSPISLPFMELERLTTERVYAEIERVIQSNQDFRLNDTVTIDINHVAPPEGSGKSRLKRTLPRIRDHLKSQKSIVCISDVTGHDVIIHYYYLNHDITQDKFKEFIHCFCLCIYMHYRHHKGRRFV